MLAGNKTYCKAEDISNVVPLFPLIGALLLPGGQIPLNIYEPRYVAMVGDVIKGDHIIAMVQPRSEGSLTSDNKKSSARLCEIGCLGRVTAWQERGDNQYLINLTGICRFRLVEEKQVHTPYRQFEISPFINDLSECKKTPNVDRKALLEIFKTYLETYNIEVNWENIQRASTEILVNTLCMISPYSSIEKQALLEAPDIKTRADTLVAITEIYLSRNSDNNNTILH